MGADVEEIYVYESGLPVDEKLKEKFYEDLTGGGIDALVFGSGLSAKNIFKMLTEKAPMEQLRSITEEKSDNSGYRSHHSFEMELNQPVTGLS